MSDAGGPVLVCFDGSAGSRAAIERALNATGGGAAVVVHAWNPLMSGAFRHGPRIEMTETIKAALAEIDDAGARHAAELAEEGAELARQAGFAPVQAVATPARDEVWRTLADTADELDARVIVVGARGRTAIGALIGSVCRALASHARQPVLVVPPPHR